MFSFAIVSYTYFDAYYYAADTILEYCCHLAGFLCNYDNTTAFVRLFLGIMFYY